MKRLKRFAAILLAVISVSVLSTTTLAAQYRSFDDCTGQPMWAFDVAVVDIRGVTHEIPVNIVSADEAFQTGMTALLRYFPQYEESFFYEVSWSRMYYRDPEMWRTEHRTDNRMVSGMQRNVPEEPIKWMGIVVLNCGGTFVFSVIPETGELIGVEYKTGGSFIAADATDKALSYRACNLRIFEIAALASQIACAGNWMVGQISSVSFRLFDACLGNTTAEAQTIEIILSSEATGEQTRLTFRTYDMELLSVHNFALSFRVMASVS